jgi:hypothetical protein
MAEQFSVETAYYPVSPVYEAAQSTEVLFDPLEIETEASQLIASREALPAVEVKAAERYDNARTALMEALTASGHLSTIEITGSLAEINAQVLQRLLNGFTKDLPFHEYQRRYYELCNELVVQKTFALVVTGELPEDTEITEISDCPVGMPEDLANSLGYRTANRKGMVRTHGLLPRPGNQFTRRIEQISRSNGTSYSTAAFMRGAGNELIGDEPEDNLAIKKTLIHTAHDNTDGVVDIQRRLDYHEGEGVLYGEIDNEYHVPYEELREESQRREVELAWAAEELADYEEKLDRALADGSINQEQKRAQYSEEVREILRAICQLAPEYAADCFGEDAAPFYHEASLQRAMGNDAVANEILRRAYNLEKTVLFCGVAIDPQVAEKLGLQLGDSESLFEKGKESWKFKRGICQVPACRSPKPTEVGPCSVCRNCQDMFDHGFDPTRLDVVSLFMQPGKRSERAER